MHVHSLHCTLSLIWAAVRLVRTGSLSLISFQLPGPSLCTARLNPSSSSTLHRRLLDDSILFNQVDALVIWNT